MKQIMPLSDYVVMQLRDRKDVSIILPENISPADDERNEFIVLYKGPECKWLEIGDGVVVNPKAVILFKYAGIEYYMTREQLVGCALREKDDFDNLKSDARNLG